MEDKTRLPEGFFDKEKLLVDKDIVNPFGEEDNNTQIGMYPYENAHSKGYIRYIIEEKTVIILDYTITEDK